jgi:hypothetical protein
MATLTNSHHPWGEMSVAGKVIQNLTAEKMGRVSWMSVPEERGPRKNSAIPNTLVSLRRAKGFSFFRRTILSSAFGVYEGGDY